MALTSQPAASVGGQVSGSRGGPSGRQERSWMSHSAALKPGYATSHVMSANGPQPPASGL